MYNRGLHVRCYLELAIVSQDRSNSDTAKVMKVAIAMMLNMHDPQLAYVHIYTRPNIAMLYTKELNQQFIQG